MWLVSHYDPCVYEVKLFNHEEKAREYFEQLRKEFWKPSYDESKYYFSKEDSFGEHDYEYYEEYLIQKISCED